MIKTSLENWYFKVLLSVFPSQTSTGNGLALVFFVAQLSLLSRALGLCHTWVPNSNWVVVNCGRLLNLSEPQFPYLEEMDSAGICLRGLLWGLNELIYLKSTAECLAQWCSYTPVIIPGFPTTTPRPSPSCVSLCWSWFGSCLGGCSYIGSYLELLAPILSSF